MLDASRLETALPFSHFFTLQQLQHSITLQHNIATQHEHCRTGRSGCGVLERVKAAAKALEVSFPPLRLRIKTMCWNIY
jgi:hypothetical protein